MKNHRFKAAIGILATLLLLGCPVNSFALLYAGIKANMFFGNGANLTGSLKINGNATSTRGAVLVPNVGLFAHYAVNQRAGVQAEVKYKHEGFGFGKEGSTVILEYIEVPLMAMYGRGWENGSFRILGTFGLSTKYLLSAVNFSYQTLPDAAYSEFKYDVSDLFHSVVLSVNVGGCFMYEMSSRLLLQSEMRFGYDVTPITDSRPKLHPYTSDTWQVNNGRIFSLSISVGIAYKI